MQSQVKFNRVPEKVPVNVWEALAQSQVRFNRIPEKIPEKVWEALVQSQVRFNGVAETEKVAGGFGAAPGQVQQGYREGSRKPWWKAKSGSTGFRRRSRGGFGAEPGHKVPEKAPEKV